MRLLIFALMLVLSGCASAETYVKPVDSPMQHDLRPGFGQDKETMDCKPVLHLVCTRRD